MNGIEQSLNMRVPYVAKVINDNYGDLEENREVAPSLEEANLISSHYAIRKSVLELQVPTLDIDLPCSLVPSSTPGHFHLFIDKVMTKKDYWKLLDVLVEVGILESGYVSVSKQRGATFVRKPGTSKSKQKKPGWEAGWGDDK